MDVGHADAIAATHAIVGVRITRSYSVVIVVTVSVVEVSHFAVSFGVAVRMGMTLGIVIRIAVDSIYV
jgi:hypothetical protein